MNSQDSPEVTLDPRDREEFLKEWDLEEGEITDQEILLAIRLGHL